MLLLAYESLKKLFSSFPFTTPACSHDLKIWVVLSMKPLRFDREALAILPTVEESCFTFARIG